MHSDDTKFDDIRVTTEPFSLTGGAYTIDFVGHGGGAVTLQKRGASGGIFEDTAEPPFPATRQSSQSSDIVLDAGVYRFALVDASAVDINLR